MRRIGLVDLEAEYRARGAALSACVEAVARQGQFVLGPAVASFEAALARHCGLAHAVGVGSGTDALLLALRAVAVGPGDVVVTTPLSFIATAEAIRRAGARPCFVDVDEQSLCLSPAAVAAYLARCRRGGAGALRDPATGDRVAALLPVHLYGRVAELAPLWSLAAEEGLAVVEDAAQAVGARAGPQPLGRGGPVCVSFFPTKNLGAWGDGGAVLTDDAGLAARIRSLRVHGFVEEGGFVELGVNSRLDALQAALLEVKLGWLAADQARRRHNAERYRQRLARVGERGFLGLPPPLGPGEVMHQFTVRVPGRRDALRDALASAGIATAVYYPRLLCDEPAIAGAALVADGLAAARRAAAEVLSLPVHPWLAEADLALVVRAIEGFLG